MSFERSDDCSCSLLLHLLWRAFFSFLLCWRSLWWKPAAGVPASSPFLILTHHRPLRRHTWPVSTALWPISPTWHHQRQSFLVDLFLTMRTSKIDFNFIPVNPGHRASPSGWFSLSLSLELDTNKQCPCFYPTLFFSLCSDNCVLTLMNISCITSLA